MADTLQRYREKRNFGVTTEPAEGGQANESARSFVIQKHWASRLHYDFRLELGGAMKSWAVPKGPSYDPSVKRMAVQVEDHPISYNQFEGTIPAGQYGAGKVIIWDEGTWEPIGNPAKGYRDGHLKFNLHGLKLRGTWALIRLKTTEKQQAWLLIKDRDDWAKSAKEFSVVDEFPDSVVPLRQDRQGGMAVNANRVTKAAQAKSTKATKSTRATKAAKATNAPKATKAGKPIADPPATDADLPGVPADLPASMKPQLATLVSGPPPKAQDWLYEVKYDGYRLLARVEDGKVKLITRNGHDWTRRMPHLAKDLARLEVQSAWIDGEIVVLVDGRPNFQALQNAFDNEQTEDIEFFVFDIPHLVGRDLRGEPLTVRRELLERVIQRQPLDHVALSQLFDVPPDELVGAACEMGLEGIIGKRREAAYVNRRADSWIKLKCSQRQEFIIAGYTEPAGSRAHFGALVLAVHDDDGTLRYAGNVGTGFDSDTLERLARRMRPLQTDQKPFKAKTPSERRTTWLEPELIAEVSFAEWTSAGHIRHAVFKGLRGDKPPSAIQREQALDTDELNEPDHDPKSPARRGKARKTSRSSTSAESAGSTKSSASNTSKSTRSAIGTKLSNPDRVIDPSTGLTKLDLARYYGLVAPLLLEHLAGRPTAFLRAPAGIHKQVFFQKHLESAMPGMRALPPELDPDHPPLIEVPSQEAVLSAAQLNVVEFHTWNAVKSAIDKPDRMLFDLDPGEGVEWEAVRQGAGLVRVMLETIGLKSWLKTSGGKGLHVVVPLRRQYGWTAVKGFSQAIVQHLAKTLPTLFVAKSGPRNRVGRIFVDYLRNGFGATTVSAWSARAREGMGISVPLTWDELEKLPASSHWTIANVHQRLDVGNGAWDDYAGQSLGAAMRRLDYEPPRDD